MDLDVFQYLYGGFDAWPINTEFLGDDQAIFRVDVFHSLAFHCKILNMPWNFDRTERNHVRFRKYMVLERLNLR